MLNNFLADVRNLLRAFKVRLQHPRVVLEESLIDLRQKLFDIETQMLAAKETDDTPKMENLQKHKLYIESEIYRLEGKRR